MRGRRVLRDFPFAETDTTLGRHTMLWSPENPNLIEATVRLLEADGTVVDEVGSYTALRSIARRGAGSCSTAGPYFLRLVLDQGYWRESHLAAPDDAALRREVEMVKDLGFNGVRLHQKVTDPRFLAWCDRLGLLVWAEMPAAYEFSPVMMERVTREWLEVLRRDYNHPCVIAWVPVNESWGVPRLERSAPQRDFVRALYHLTKGLDPTRLVIGNDGWEQIVSDVITVHDYTGRGEVLRQRYGTREAVQQTLTGTQPQQPVAAGVGHPLGTPAPGRQRVRGHHVRDGRRGALARLRRGAVGEGPAGAVPAGSSTPSSTALPSPASATRS